MEVYCFRDHEGGGPYQRGIQLRWLQGLFKGLIGQQNSGVRLLSWIGPTG